jgi:predicted phage replisome organizer
VAEGKFYWLKLKRDFFKRHDIRIIEAMPNGKDYILFYLKLLLESIDHEGKLRFSETIPYNEQMLSVITNTNVDVVKAAMDVFIGLQMIEIEDDKTIYMQEVEKLIGSTVDNDNANRQRRFRERQKQLALQNVTDGVTKSNESKSIEIEKDIEIEGEGKKGPDVTGPTTTASPLERMGGTLGQNVLMLTEEQNADLLDRLSLDEYDLYCKKLSDYIIAHPEKTFKSHYATILKWVEEDRSVMKEKNGVYKGKKSYSLSEIKEILDKRVV